MILELGAPPEARGLQSGTTPLFHAGGDALVALLQQGAAADVSAEAEAGGPGGKREHIVPFKMRLAHNTAARARTPAEAQGGPLRDLAYLMAYGAASRRSVARRGRGGGR